MLCIIICNIYFPQGDVRGRYYTKTHEWFQVEDDGVGTVASASALRTTIISKTGILQKHSSKLGSLDSGKAYYAEGDVASVSSPENDNNSTSP